MLFTSVSKENLLLSVVQNWHTSVPTCQGVATCSGAAAHFTARKKFTFWKRKTVPLFATCIILCLEVAPQFVGFAAKGTLQGIEFGSKWKTWMSARGYVDKNAKHTHECGMQKVAKFYIPVCILKGRMQKLQTNMQVMQSFPLENMQKPGKCIISATSISFCIFVLVCILHVQNES